MAKEERQEELEDAFVEFALNYPQSALSMMAGLLVGFLEHSIEKSGGNKDAEIKIDAGGRRDITIHAVTPNRQ